jgi:hypothetical protein
MYGISTLCSLPCRVMSLHDDCKVSIADSNGIAILLPFLTVKLDAVRWAARQVLNVYVVH